ncbi:MAG: GH92 family glycosyl hydrolase [Muribaculaceae bacterium]|nr:GH92 family glycosyl hydrolase [Muribaculaceae bacterium]
MKKIGLLLGLLLVIVLEVNGADNVYAERVNTLIGTKGVGLTSGYLYPGATYPFGMVQFTPSYFSGRSGFVINQLSGGGCAHMGNFPTFPVKGKLKRSPENILDYRVNLDNQKGHAGYYEANVDDDIKAMLSVTERTGMAKYDYPADADYGTVMIGAGVAATPIEVAAVAITGTNSCEGYAEGGSFCGIETPFKVYFVAEFDAEAVETGTWKDDKLHPKAAFAEGAMSGVYFTFDTSSNKSIQYKIGVSYVSVENARLNLATENPGWSFDSVRNAAESRWNDYLSLIEVDGTNDDRITQFYTHLYRVLIHPNVCSDVNGEYMGADFKVHTTKSKQYTSFSNWDTYRTQIQLLAMLDPEVASDVVLSHQHFAEQSGGSFPRWVMANIETGVMQGDPSSILVANAWAFGARNYDPKPLLEIMRKGAEQPGSKSQKEETRPGLKQYLDKGYYNASIQLEYTSADFAIGQFALRACGDEFLSWRYFHFARSWKNLFNKETGWLQSRRPDGSWKPLTDDFRESSYKNYFWMVPYDIDGLIEIIGGKEAADKRLDELFVRLDAGYSDDWFASGNEPSFQIPWCYNWVGKPYKTQAMVNRILNEQYSSAIDGLPGNDDLGTMGAWYVFACMGLYPQIPGIGGFAINTPVFESVKIHLKNGDLVINGGSEKNIYINKMLFNGQPYESTWIDWADVSNGAVIDYTVSSKPNVSWGTKIAPPSYK